MRVAHKHKLGPMAQHAKDIARLREIARIVVQPKKPTARIGPQGQQMRTAISDEQIRLARQLRAERHPIDAAMAKAARAARGCSHVVTLCREGFGKPHEGRLAAAGRFTVKRFAVEHDPVVGKDDARHRRP